jgi:hypothetical protein
MARSNLFLVLLWLVTLLSSCASPPSSGGGLAAHGYALRMDGNDVSVTFTRDLTIPEFLQLAQEVTSARYVYKRDQVASSGPVTLVGQIHCQRSEFPAFLDTMLHMHGLRAEVRGSGDQQYVEIEPIAKG